MSLLPQQPAPVSRRDAVRTACFLTPALAALEAFFLDIRRETDAAFRATPPTTYGTVYPIGYCKEITFDVLRRLTARMKAPRGQDDRGGRALRAFFDAGGTGRCVWGALRGRYFQTALQFGGLYVDVANDTVVVTKPKIEILPMAASGLEAIRDAWHFAAIAESYWGMRSYANHALPSLAPALPVIGLFPAGNVTLQSCTGYMMELFRRDGFERAEDWLARGPAPPDCIVAALRTRCPEDLLAVNPDVGAAAAVSSCRAARRDGAATDPAWLRARVTEFERL